MEDNRKTSSNHNHREEKKNSLEWPVLHQMGQLHPTGWGFKQGRELKGSQRTVEVGDVTAADVGVVGMRQEVHEMERKGLDGIVQAESERKIGRKTDKSPQENQDGKDFLQETLFKRFCSGSAALWLKMLKAWWKIYLQLNPDFLSSLIYQGHIKHSVSVVKIPILLTCPESYMPAMPSTQWLGNEFSFVFSFVLCF